jgi:hypothetical protein
MPLTQLYTMGIDMVAGIAIIARSVERMWGHIIRGQERHWAF